MKVVLISTYELGHQPFGLASPAAWLRRAGAEVVCLDLSRQSFHEEAIRAADVVAFYVPMHTATRLAIPLIEPVRRLNPRAHLCFYGLYAPVNEAYLRDLGVDTILGGEFEGALAELVTRLADAMAKLSARCGGAKQEHRAQASASRSAISLERLNFIPPDRSGLPALREYAHLLMPEGGFKVAGYTEASRGCKHLCRHCPVVPVYNGVFRIVQRDVVVEDIRRQVDAGAEHVTFGDPDFFNGPAHALAIVEALHREFPQLSYDVTIKIEHLLQHKDAVRKLRDTGCLFATSAVESVDDAILARLAKGPYARGFSRCGRRLPRIGVDPAAHLRAFYALDDARRLSRTPGAHRGTGFGGKCRAHSAGHPPADSGGLAPAGIGRGANGHRRFRRLGARLSLEAPRSPHGHPVGARAGVSQ